MELRNISTRTVTLRDSLNTVYTVPAYGNVVVSDGLWTDNEFRRWLRMRIRDVVVIPTSVQTGFASLDESYITTVGTAGLTNEKILGSDIIMRGTLAARPSPSIPGRLYFITDAGQQKWTRDSGIAWEDSSLHYDSVTGKPTTFSPISHAASHSSASTDPLTGTLDANARVLVKHNGATIGTRRSINLLDGNDTTLTVADDSSNEEVEVTIASGSAGKEIDYVERTTTLTIAAAGSAIITGTTKTFENIPYWIEFWCMRLDGPTQSLAGGGSAVTISFQIDGANIYTISINPLPDAPSTHQNLGFYVPFKHTPTAGSHTYRVFGSGGNTQAIVNATGTVPSFLRITKVS